MVDELSANRKAAVVVTWFRAEVRVHERLEEDTAGGFLVKTVTPENLVNRLETWPRRPKWSLDVSLQPTFLSRRNKEISDQTFWGN